MIKTKNVQITVYELQVGCNKKTGVIAQFTLDGVMLERDKDGTINLKSKITLQKALEDALSRWEFGNM